MPPPPAPSLPALQHLATLTAATLTGATLSLSTLAVPLLLAADSTPALLRQAARLLAASRTLFARLVPLLAAGPYLALALACSLPSGRRLYLAAAGLLLLGLPPYGWLVMGREERMLEARARALGARGGALGEAACEVEEMGLPPRETTRYLVDRWGVLNLGRVAMVAGAGLLGLGAQFGLAG